MLKIWFLMFFQALSRFEIGLIVFEYFYFFDLRFQLSPPAFLLYESEVNMRYRRRIS